MNSDEIGGLVIAGGALLAIAAIIFFGLRMAKQNEEKR